MNVRHKIETAKSKFEELKETAHLRNPLRIRREKKHNQELFDIIKANGGRMPASMWNQTFFAQHCGLMVEDDTM